MFTKAKILFKLSHLKPILNKEFNIEKIGLFGSFATENYNENSDIDILFELKGDEILSLKSNQKLEELFIKEFQTHKIDLVNKKYLNPIIEQFIKDKIVYV